MRLLAAMLLCALVAGACARRQPEVGQNGDMTIEFWDFPHLPETNEYLARAMRQFEQDNPGVRVRYTRLPWQDGQQKVVLSMNSGRPPDVCGQVNVSPMFIAQDVLEPLENYIEPIREDIYPAYLDAVSAGEHVYAVPWYKACYVALLNLDLFEKFGVEPPAGGRWSWEEFLAAMRALTAFETPAGERLKELPPRALMNAKSYYGLVTNLGPAEYEAYSIIFNAGGRILRRGPSGSVVSAVAEPGFLRGLERLVQLEHGERVCMPGIGAMTQEQSWNVWRDSRTCAVTLQGAWCVAAMKRVNAAIEETNERKRAAGRDAETEKPIRWTIAAPPHDGGTTPVLGSSGLGTYVVFRQEDQRKRDMCAKFALTLTSGEGQTVLKHENVWPSRRSTGNLWVDDEVLGPVFSLFPDGVMSPLVPGGERVDRVLQPEIQKALLTDRTTGKPQASPEEAVRVADEKLRAILDRASRRSVRQNEAR